MINNFTITGEVKEIIEDFVNEFAIKKKILKGELDDKVRLVQYPVGDFAQFYVIEFDNEAIGSVLDKGDSCILTTYYSGRNYGESTSLIH